MDRRTDGPAVSERPRPLSTCAAAWKSRWRAWTRRKRDELLPARCLLCGDRSRGDALCGPCLRGLPGTISPCPGCALPLGHNGAALCGACQLVPRPWLAATATLRYDFPTNRLVRALKFHGNLAAGAALVQAMSAGPAPVVTAGSRPWIVPVPLHGLRERVRGFNQAMELARPLGAQHGWKLVDGLRRIRRTTPQTRLDGKQRRTNLRGAFRWQGPSLEGRSIVLVDDVLTTGATLEACGRALGEAAGVSVWVAARALSPEDDQESIFLPG